MSICAKISLRKQLLQSSIGGIRCHTFTPKNYRWQYRINQRSAMMSTSSNTNDSINDGDNDSDKIDVGSQRSIIPSNNCYHLPSTPLSSSSTFNWDSCLSTTIGIRHFSATSSSTTNTNTNTTRNNNEDDEHKEESKDGIEQDEKTRKQKMQLAAKHGATSIQSLIQKYGKTFIGTYLSIYVLTLSTLFTGLDSGLIDPTSLSHLHLPWHTTGEGEAAAAEAAADAKEFSSSVEFVVRYLDRFEFTRGYSDVVKENPHLTNLAIAWVATKFTEPLRLPLTIALCPRVNRYVMKWKDVTEEGDDLEGKEKKKVE